MRWNRTGNQRILLRARSGTGGELGSEPYGFARGSPDERGDPGQMWNSHMKSSRNEANGYMRDDWRRAYCQASERRVT